MIKLTYDLKTRLIGSAKAITLAYTISIAAITTLETVQKTDKIESLVFFSNGEITKQRAETLYGYVYGKNFGEMYYNNVKKRPEILVTAILGSVIAATYLTLKDKTKKDENKSI
jgi:hypothetical protein